MMNDHAGSEADDLNANIGRRGQRGQTDIQFAIATTLSLCTTGGESRVGTNNDNAQFARQACDLCLKVK